LQWTRWQSNRNLSVTSPILYHQTNYIHRTFAIEAQLHWHVVSAWSSPIYRVTEIRTPAPSDIGRRQAALDPSSRFVTSTWPTNQLPTNHLLSWADVTGDWQQILYQRLWSWQRMTIARWPTRATRPHTETILALLCRESSAHWLTSDVCGRMLSVKLMRCLRDWSLDISWRLTRAGPATRLRGCDLSGLHVRPLGRRRFFPAALTTTTTTRRLTSLLTDCCCCYRSVRPMRGTRRMEGGGGGVRLGGPEWLTHHYQAWLSRLCYGFSESRPWSVIFGQPI